LYAETEFQGGKTGMCGVNAAAMAEATLTQNITGNRSLDMFARMYARGLCDANGITNINKIASMLATDKFQVKQLGYLPNTAPLPISQVYAFLDQYACGNAVVILETSIGQNFKDFLSGKGENARNLAYHIVTVYGKNPGGASGRTKTTLPVGRWVMDGDNFATAGTTSGMGPLVYYPDGIIAAVKPVALLAIFPKQGVVVGNTAGLGSGFLDLYHQHGKSANVVFSDTYINSTEAYALLDDGTGYYYNKANGALDDTHGPTVLHWLYDQWQNSLNADKVEDAAAVQQLASVNAALQQANNDKTTLARQHSDDQTTIQNLQDQVAKLEAQVSELQDQVVNAPTPAPVAPVVDQQAEDAKVALENIAQLLAQYMAPKA
jgi:hypothetical protein